MRPLISPVIPHARNDNDAMIISRAAPGDNAIALRKIISLLSIRAARTRRERITAALSILKKHNNAIITFFMRAGTRARLSYTIVNWISNYNMHSLVSKEKKITTTATAGGRPKADYEFLRKTATSFPRASLLVYTLLLSKLKRPIN